MKNYKKETLNITGYGETKTKETLNSPEKKFNIE